MKINQEFFSSIYPVLTELKELFGNEFVVFGSAPLYLLNVVPFNGSINDLDIAASETTKIPSIAEEVHFYDNPDQKLFKLRLQEVNIDVGTCWPGQEKMFLKIFNDPIVIEDFKFANLAVVKEWKQLMVEQYGREKDKKYVTAIEKSGLLSGA